MFENGSEIVRADFHLHTNADKEFKYTGDSNRYVTEYVEKLQEQKITIGVITNHNKFDLAEYKAIRALARKRGILILPGLELSVKEGRSGVHALFIFNPDEWIKNDADYISAMITSLFVGIHNYENENTHCNKDFLDCLDKFEKQDRDFFVVFAHVEQNSGLWEECQGAVITAISKNPLFQRRVLGFQKVRTRDTAKKVRDWMGYSIAHLEGSDPKSIDEIGKGKETYLKLGAQSFSAVKNALRDYGNRVFESTPTLSHSYIKKVQFIGGDFDGISFHPSSALNTLIGIRGSGKSSLLEAIRYALDLDASSQDKDYKDGLLKKNLKSGAQIELTVVDKYGREYTITRILNETVTIRDSMGTKMDVSIKTLLNNPLYFGQKDLALTQRGDEFELLDKFMGNTDPGLDREKDRLSSLLSDDLNKLIDLEDAETRVEDIKTEIHDLKHRLTIYKEKGIDEKLKKQIKCNQDLITVTNVYEIANKASQVLQESQKQCRAEDISLENYDSEYNDDIIVQAKAHAMNLTNYLHDMNKSLELFTQEKEKYRECVDSLEQRIDFQKEEFAKIKREIDDDGLDLESYVTLQKQLSTKEQECQNFQSLISEKAKVEKRVSDLLTQRQTIQKKQFDYYSTQAQMINTSQAHIKIEMTFRGDTRLFLNEIKSFFKGTSLSEQRCQELATSFSCFEEMIEDYFVHNGEKLKEILTDAMYAKVAARLKEEYSSLLQYRCPNDIKFKYHEKLLSSHSLGQRTCALLLFILTKCDNDVVIIDQPEDDLDNQVIYTEVIKTIRERKENVQLIFATHNANIPVLGDAERVATAEYSEEEGKMVLNESTIDDESAHDDIVRIMEGGEDAFRRRNEIYSSWKTKKKTH